MIGESGWKDRNGLVRAGRKTTEDWSEWVRRQQRIGESRLKDHKALVRVGRKPAKDWSEWVGRPQRIGEGGREDHKDWQERVERLQQNRICTTHTAPSPEHEIASCLIGHKNVIHSFCQLKICTRQKPVGYALLQVNAMIVIGTKCCIALWTFALPGFIACANTLKAKHMVAFEENAVLLPTIAAWAGESCLYPQTNDNTTLHTHTQQCHILTL